MIKKIWSAWGLLPAAILLLIFFQNCAEFETMSDLAGQSSSSSQYNLLVQQGRKVHFGYYASAANNENYKVDLAAMKGHANTSFVQLSWSSGSPFGSMRDRILESRSHGMKSIVHVQPYFFQYGPKGEMTSILRPDHMEQWGYFKEAIKDLHDDILAIYIFDEPVAANDLTVPPHLQLPHEEIYRNLTKVNEIVKKDLPNLPTVLVFGSTEVHAGMLMPPADWVGLDCYGNVYNCVDDRGRSMSIKAFHDILKSRMHPHQKIILFPQAFRWDKPGSEWNISDEAVANQVDYYRKMVGEEPRVVGVFPYLWQDSDIMGYKVHGTSSLPITRAKFQELASYLAALSQEPTQPNQDKVPEGYFDDVTSDGLLTGWAVDMDAPDKSIDVHIYIDGDFRTGKIIGSVQANIMRPDVNSSLGIKGNHGFAFQIPSIYKDNVSHSYFVYGINSNPLGQNTLLLATQRSYVLPKTNGAYRWHTDTFSACSAAPFFSYSNWGECSNGIQNRTAQCAGMSGIQSRNVVCRTSDNKIVANSFCEKLGSMPAKNRDCSVSCTGTPQTTQKCSDMKDQTPTGYVDNISPTGLINGWSADLDTPSISNEVHIYVDGDFRTGKWVGRTVANTPRPDVNAAVGISGSHGFSFQIPNLYKDGKSRTYYIYGINTNAKGQNILLNSGKVQFTFK